MSYNVCEGAKVVPPKGGCATFAVALSLRGIALEEVGT